jgi:hypothetical protein
MTSRMRTTVDELRGAGWPSVFSYVYDDFWAVWRTPSLVKFLSANLGEGYLQTAGVWTYRVDPEKQGSGWRPHVDSRDDVARLSIWIPLTDATIRNGCMYVVPKDEVPPGLPSSYLDWTSVSTANLGSLLHAVTPLPAQRGSILGWDNRLIHWGGKARGSGGDIRMSIAAEFLPAGTRPKRSERPALGLNLPDFPTRLRIIAQAILSYERFEPMMRRYGGLARRLVDYTS